MTTYRRLNDGLNLEVDPIKGIADVTRLGVERAEKTYEGVDLECYARMGYGLYPDDEVSEGVEACYAQLVRDGFAGEHAQPTDSEVEVALQDLGDVFRWSVPLHPQQENLITTLRNARSARKLHLNGFGQMQCLPETAVGRCLTLAKDLGTTKAKVLIIGDDDLMALTLAQLGFAVTAIDIDKDLIDFINREAKRLNLDVDAHVHDVLAPLEDNVLATYDAVITDPMSYKNCQIAFLSRALAVTKVGGTVLCCVTPAARRMFLEVDAVLPVEVVEYRNNFNAYSFHRFAENGYKSDLLTLRRTDGPLPYPADVAIPFSAITDGDHVWARYANLSFRVIKIGLKRKLSETALRERFAAEGFHVARVVEHNGNYSVHVFHDAGHAMQLHVDVAKGQFELHVYPGFGEVPEAAAAELARPFSVLKSRVFYSTAVEVPNFVPAVAALGA